MAVDALPLRLCLPVQRSPAEVPTALELVRAVLNVIAAAGVAPEATLGARTCGRPSSAGGNPDSILCSNDFI